jgi:hypothetical protein
MVIRSAAATHLPSAYIMIRRPTYCSMILYSERVLPVGTPWVEICSRRTIMAAICSPHITIDLALTV